MGSDFIVPGEIVRKGPEGYAVKFKYEDSNIEDLICKFQAEK